MRNKCTHLGKYKIHISVLYMAAVAISRSRAMSNNNMRYNARVNELLVCRFSIGTISYD